MMARTHGQFAIPTTFGFKSRRLHHRDDAPPGEAQQVRLRAAWARCPGPSAPGRHSAQVHIHPDLVMKQLGLGYEEAATQIVCRDRYAEVISLLAMICTSCERYATEIRNLQRSEMQEVSEAFDNEKQVGISTMAQKKNPITSENICGLARIARGFIYPAMEDMVLWHERDLTEFVRGAFHHPSRLGADRRHRDQDGRGVLRSGRQPGQHAEEHRIVQGADHGRGGDDSPGRQGHGSAGRSCDRAQGQPGSGEGGRGPSRKLCLRPRR